MDDFGNELHWTTFVQGWHCMGLYGYADDYGIAVLYGSIDFSEVQ